MTKAGRRRMADGNSDILAAVRAVLAGTAASLRAHEGMLLSLAKTLECTSGEVQGRFWLDGSPATVERWVAGLLGPSTDTICDELRILAERCEEEASRDWAAEVRREVAQECEETQASALA